ncbi:MAG: hypothetical protein FWH23_02495 [Bacteroidales bacterium]|nr:hypothetical protein [Bacteroidales bacterium]MCL2133417.1 hypothetical protein [Bacteroidales bacterium]
MDSPFIFTQPVVGDNFVSRKSELDWLSSNLSNRQHSVLIAPPLFGKRSIVTNALFQARRQQDLLSCVLSLFNVRNEFVFYTSLVNTLMRAVCATSDEWETVAQQFLSETRPLVNIDEAAQNGVSFIFDKAAVMAHADELLNLPERLAEWKNKGVALCIHDFQDISQFEDTKVFQKKLCATWKQHRFTTYLLCGSKKNAAAALFSEKMPFHKFGDIVQLERLDERLSAEYVMKSFAKSGRVISKEFAEALHRKVSGYPYYVQLLAHICWSNTKGFVTDSVMNRSMEDLYDYNERIFRRITDELSPSQLNYLQAIVDGVLRFSSAENLQRYELHSSANVARVREALEKKEILSFDRYNMPTFIDPVFELWYRNRFANR